jgi:hypothetical protein
MMRDNGMTAVMTVAAVRLCCGGVARRLGRSSLGCMGIGRIPAANKPFSKPNAPWSLPGMKPVVIRTVVSHRQGYGVH